MSLLLLAALIGSVTAFADFPVTCHPTQLGQECVPPGEPAFHAYTATRILEIQNSVAAEDNAPRKRAFHAKPHGCFIGEFRVLEGIPYDYRVGPLFGNPGKEYRAVVRFSNGHPGTRSDVMPDFRGLAIKVLGVGGRKIRQENATTVDFLMMNAPLAPSKDAPGFVDFVNATMPPRGTMDMASYMFRRAPPEVRKFIFDHLITRVVNSARTERYWSVAPYKWGPNRAMRFQVKPCPHAPKPRIIDFFKGDKLRQDIEKIAMSRNICFDFFVQLQVDLWNTPVENVAVEWPETVSTPVRVARLILPQIDATSDRSQKVQQRCENLRFTPFNTVEDYRPIGSASRVREQAYSKSQEGRRAHFWEPDEHECFHC